MQNSERMLVKIVNEISKEEGINIESFSHDWIIKLEKNEKIGYIMGYQFGLNSASVNSICCDKSAASEIMQSFKIPHVEHYFFMSPINQKYIGENGNWEKISELLYKFGSLVCKPNEGTGGNGIYHVTNQYELENASYKIFKNNRAMAISPFYNIENEFRTIVLDSKVKLIYSKERQYVVGDGIKSLKDLVLEKPEIFTKPNTASMIDLNNSEFEKILRKNEKYYINWKHNLGQGAKAIETINDDIKEEVIKLVNLVVSKLNIRFASIDVVKCNDSYRVLEINSGVMMENYAQQDESTYEKAKTIYKEAIFKMLEKGE